MIFEGKQRACGERAGRFGAFREIMVAQASACDH
jgi:hypothetical protein